MNTLKLYLRGVMLIALVVFIGMMATMLGSYTMELISKYLTENSIIMAGSGVFVLLTFIATCMGLIWPFMNKFLSEIFEL